MAIRKIIEIDEEKCTGCGECIVACAEGALELVDGKAKLVGDILCDGLGACMGECPEGALKIIERESVEFDEGAVGERLKELEAEKAPAPLACGCPGSNTMVLEHEETKDRFSPNGDIPSNLGHWPIKLQLLGPQAPFLKAADLVLLADCAATSYPNLHRDFLGDRVVAMGCPKLDDLDAHITRLAEILKGAKPRSLTVLHMEVPCCKGFVFAAEKAMEMSGEKIPLRRIMIGRDGKIMEEEEMICVDSGCNCHCAAGGE